MKGNKEWLAPLTGVAFIAVAIVGFAVGGEPPGADEAAQKIADHYIDNKDSIEIGALLAGLAAALFVFFGGYLRKVLRAAEGEGGVLSAVAFAGTIVFAVGIAIDGMISFAIAERADEVAPIQVQTLQVLWDNDWLPLAVGLLLLLFSAGLSIVRHGALPKWLGWVAILLGIVAITPAGFVGFIGAAVWVLIVSILLATRGRSTRTTA